MQIMCLFLLLCYAPMPEPLPCYAPESDYYAQDYACYALVVYYSLKSFVPMTSRYSSFFVLEHNKLASFMHLLMKC